MESTLSESSSVTTSASLHSSNTPSTSLPIRTWGGYPEIQKDFPYSDQCIAATIQRYMDWAVDTPEFKEMFNEAWKDYLDTGMINLTSK